MKSFVLGKKSKHLVSVSLLLCLIGAPSGAAAQAWRALTPEQRVALAPMDQQWDTLPEIQRKRLLETAKSYPHLTHEQKERYHKRLVKWSKLTPEQREAARKKYRAFNKLPAPMREDVKQMIKEEQQKKAQQSTSGIAATPSTDHP
jgi:hypothetical protein